MAEYTIEDIKLALYDGGMPFFQEVAVSLKINNGKGSRWLHAVDTAGIISFLITDDDMNERLLHDRSDEMVDIYNRLSINEFDGVDLEFLHSMIDNPGKDPATDLINYLLLLLRCPMADYEGYVALGKGKRIGDFEVPYVEI